MTPAEPATRNLEAGLIVAEGMVQGEQNNISVTLVAGTRGAAAAELNDAVYEGMVAGWQNSAERLMMVWKACFCLCFGVSLQYTYMCFPRRTM